MVIAGSAKLKTTQRLQAGSSWQPWSSPSFSFTVSSPVPQNSDTGATEVGLPTLHLLTLAGGREGGFPGPTSIREERKSPTPGVKPRVQPHGTGWHVLPQADPAESSSKIQEASMGRQASYAPK